MNERNIPAGSGDVDEAEGGSTAGVPAGPKCDRCNDTGWHYSDPLDPTSLEPCCEPTRGVLASPEPQGEKR